MSGGTGGAKIGSLDALEELRAAINLFQAEASAALSEADADLQRTVQWLRLDRLAHWQRQVRVRQEELVVAKNNLERRLLAAAPDTPSAIEERRALAKAKAGVQEAVERLAAVRRWLTVWEREAALYKGQCQPLQDLISRDLPMAAARLQRMRENLEQYVHLAAPTGGGSEQGAGAVMSRLGGGTEDADGEEGVVAGVSPLRKRTPRSGMRGAAPAVNVGAVITCGEALRLATEDAESLGRLGLSGEPPADGAVVVIEEGVLAEAMIYLERVETAAGAGDSGWFVGSALRGALGALQSVTVAALLERRPDLRPVLSLPVGTLVLLSGGHVQSLLGREDRELWHTGGGAGL